MSRPTVSHADLLHALQAWLRTYAHHTDAELADLAGMAAADIPAEEARLLLTARRFFADQPVLGGALSRISTRLIAGGAVMPGEIAGRTLRDDIEEVVVEARLALQNQRPTTEAAADEVPVSDRAEAT